MTESNLGARSDRLTTVPATGRSSSLPMAISADLAVALDDLSSRFFLNLPKPELDSFERLFFQLEQAWWFYDDFYRDQHPDRRLPKFAFKDFCLCLFEQCGALRPHIPNFERHFAQFRAYLAKVPVCGAILLDPSMTSCVLVRGYQSRTWSFPKGKINQGERPLACAVREVLEETGLEVGALVSDHHVLQAVVKGKLTILYVAPNVPSDAAFATQTRKEIADIRWFDIDDLDHADPNRFWSVAPFLYKLRAWIAAHRQRDSRAGSRSTPTPRRARSSRTRRGGGGAPVSDTFGCVYTTWPAEEMFAVNARLFGVRSTSVSDPNQLSAMMADRSAMSGTVQWHQATEALKRQLPPPDHTQPYDGDAAADPRTIGGQTTAPDHTRSMSSSRSNALLSFDLDDAGIMSHFFQQQA